MLLVIVPALETFSDLERLQRTRLPWRSLEEIWRVTLKDSGYGNGQPSNFLLSTNHNLDSEVRSKFQLLLLTLDDSFFKEILNTEFTLMIF